MGIPLESAKSSSDKILMSQDYQTLRARLANQNPGLRQNKAKKNLADSLQILLATT